LYASSTNVKLGIDERKAAYQRLQELYPAYFKNIDFENLKNAQSVGIYKELRQAIFDKSRAKAIENELQKRADERLEKEIELRENIARTEAEISKIKKGANVVVIQEASAIEKTAQITATKNDLLAAQQKLLKIQKTELDSFTKNALASDTVLLNSKAEYDQKSTKLTENEIARQKAIIAQTGVQVEAVGGLKVGTIAYYESLIALAQKAQKEVATNSTEFDLLQTKIDGYQKQIDAISKKEIKLPKPEIPNADTSFETPSLDNTLSGLKDQLAYFERLRENLSTTSAEYQAYSEVING
jgi:tubulin-specific chaperone A